MSTFKFVEKSLTDTEKAAVWRVLDAVLEKIHYNKDMKSYVDDVDIVICLDKAQ